MPFREVAQSTAGLEIVSRFNLISEKREENAQFKKLWNNVHFLLSRIITTHIRLIHKSHQTDRPQALPILRRMFNVEKVKRRKVILKKIITLSRVKCLNVPSLMLLMSDSWFSWLLFRLGLVLMEFLFNF